MPVVEAAAEPATPPAAPVRSRAERSPVGSQLASAPPIDADRDVLRARRHDIEGDARFIKSMLPTLPPDARERASHVRLRAGDPAAGLLGLG